MAALNHEADDVRDGKIDLSKMVVNLKNHFYYLQEGYVKMLVKKNDMKKLKCLLGFLFVVGIRVATYKFFH